MVRSLFSLLLLSIWYPSGASIPALGKLRSDLSSRIYRHRGVGRRTFGSSRYASGFYHPAAEQADRMEAATSGSDLKDNANNADSSHSFHLHFGAGKLGCGLVMKSLEDSGQHYGVIQRPSSSFMHLVDNGVDRVVVNVNGEQVTSPMRLLHGEDVANVEMITHGGPFMIISDNGNAEVMKLASKAKSFSCSLNKGLPDLKRLLSNLPVRADPPKLFACENDHEAVEQLAADLSGKVAVVPCMVDRICSKRDIHPDGTLDVQAEPWGGQIVVLPPLQQQQQQQQKRRENNPEIVAVPNAHKNLFNWLDPIWDFYLSLPESSPNSQLKDDKDGEESAAAAIPFGGPAVVKTETQEQANYYSKRKLLLVNGAHTTLAFLTLAKELKNLRGDLENMALPGKYPLLDYQNADEATRSKIWAWLVARCYIIANEFPSSVLKSAHGVESEREAFLGLLNYAWETMHRFSHVPDTTERVLSGGIVERYGGRLKNVLEKMNEFDKFGQVPYDPILLAAASGYDRPKLTAKSVREAVEGLVEDAAPIAKEKRNRDQITETSDVTGARVYNNLVSSSHSTLSGQRRSARLSRAPSGKESSKSFYRPKDSRYPAMETRSTLKRFQRAASHFGGTGAA